jgi:hypothetical protein
MLPAVIEDIGISIIVMLFIILINNLVIKVIDIGVNYI